MVQTHQHSVGVLKKGDQDQATCDALGKSVKFYIILGQDADTSRAEPMLDDIDPDAFLTDKAMMQIDLIDRLTERGIPPVIPPKSNKAHQGKPTLPFTWSETLLIYYPIKSMCFSLPQHVTIN
ncbi:transposase [Acetobacter sp. A11-2]|uniref:transposase n=1 Tax=Acetobacter sp. A11-2 TaxID=3157859 RepID=UPI0032ED1A7B